MQLTGDAYSALSRVLGNLPVPAETLPLVVGGDWFDTNRPSSEDVAWTRNFMRKFMCVRYIKGNHDSCEPSFLDSLFGIGGFMERLSPGQLHLPGWPLVGVDWSVSADATRDAIRLAAAASNPFRPLYLVLHASFKHLLGFDGAYQLDAEWIKDTFKDRCVRVLVGDIHTRNTLELPHGSWIHSPGSLYPRSWDKVREPCAVSLVDADTGEITSIPCDVRRYEEIEYAGHQDLLARLEALSAEHAEGDLDTFVRVVVPPGSEPFGRPQVPHVQVQVVSADTEDGEERAEAPVAETTLLDAVREECGDDADLADMAGALLSSDDPLAEIERWLDFWKVERIA